MKRLLAMFVLIASMLAFGGIAFAEGTPAPEQPFDFLSFAVQQLLTEAHPTTDVAKAKAEFVSEPAQDGDNIKARVKIYYKGWMKDNSMVVEIFLKQTGGSRLVKADLLEDTAATGGKKSKYFIGWQEVE